MNGNKSHGMEKIDRYYEDYGARARELKGQGERVMIYLCSFVPVEMLTAAGFIPFRIRGSVHEPITKGDTQLETIACPFMRSCFDLSLKGHYDFADGVIIPHACDSITRSYSVWRYSLGLPYSHFINLPHTARGPSMTFFKNELTTLRKSLERFTGKEITDEALAEAIEAYNANRDKAKGLYELRKSDPPLVSGTEILKILTVGMSLPVEEANELFDEVLNELEQRTEPSRRKEPRILVEGACVDNIDFIKLIEDSGANVVADSLCIGTRDYWPHAETGVDPIESLAHRYLDKINCPRTYREKKGDSYEDDLEARFGDVGSLVKEFSVDGVIMYLYKYCDPFGFEAPAREMYLDNLGVPSLYLEDEYSIGTIGRMRTRIQAFLEMMS
ncbi:MAG: 2-hydroxyacyl-CoA dehydratase subunit D [Thermodesulfobacteriota bacterium]